VQDEEEDGKKEAYTTGQTPCLSNRKTTANRKEKAIKSTASVRKTKPSAPTTSLTTNSLTQTRYPKSPLKMHFPAFLLTALATLAVASPNSLARRDNEEVAAAIRFAAVQADCNIVQCAGVIASAACIALSIPLGPAGVPGALGCVAGGASAVCLLIFFNLPYSTRDGMKCSVKCEADAFNVDLSMCRVCQCFERFLGG
jgi:hypothetical protein